MRLVGKLGSTPSPPIQNMGSWGSGKRPLITSSELPHHLYRIRPRGEARVNFLTTYIERGLVGKLGSTSSPPIQKRGSWGSSSQLPHHLYRKRPRGEARANFPTTYTEDGFVGKLGSTSSPPIQEMGSWGRRQMSADYTPHPTPTSSPPIEMTGSWGSARAQLPHHLYR